MAYARRPRLLAPAAPSDDELSHVLWGGLESSDSAHSDSDAADSISHSWPRSHRIGGIVSHRDAKKLQYRDIDPEGIVFLEQPADKHHARGTRADGFSGARGSQEAEVEEDEEDGSEEDDAKTRSAKWRPF